MASVKFVGDTQGLAVASKGKKEFSMIGDSRSWIFRLVALSLLLGVATAWHAVTLVTSLQSISSSQATYNLQLDFSDSLPAIPYPPPLSTADREPATTPALSLDVLYRHHAVAGRAAFAAGDRRCAAAVPTTRIGHGPRRSTDD